MANLRKTLSLITILVLLASVLATSTAALAKPPVPEFTASASGTTLVVSIKNPQFSEYEENGSRISLYYDIEVKRNSDTEWGDVYWNHQYPSADLEHTYTVITTTIDNPVGSQVDVRVQAIIGTMALVNARLWGGCNYYAVSGEAGEWSSPKTVTVSPSTVATVTPQPTQNPTGNTSPTATTNPQETNQPGLQLNLDWISLVLIVMAVAIVGLMVAVALLWRKVTAKST
ncbi:MAG: hypothetical protein ACQCN6_05050 [Candidatus Bathyarchaeia archaeon]|jgi:hypothetical protein